MKCFASFAVPRAHPRVRTVSAPGKVLITGGYLVTDRAHTGLVLVTDAAFRTVGICDLSLLFFLIPHP